MRHVPTKTEIQDWLLDAGLRASKHYGQHFLVDGNTMRIVVREAELLSDDTVLEVGAGVGNLTGLLAAEAGHVVSVEIDPEIAEIARRHLEDLGAENVDLVVTDVLADKHTLAPQVHELTARRAEAQGGDVKLVANLPYSAATPLLVELLTTDPVPNMMVFTVQEEVAERLTALPGTKDYGLVSVIVQALGEVEVLRRLSPNVFWPRPRVWSSLVRLWPSPARRRGIEDLGVLREVLDGLFGHRRKVAPKSLSLSDLGPESSTVWSQRLEAAGLDPSARGEAYTVEEIVRLANAVANERA